MAEDQAGSKRKSAPVHDPLSEVRAALREAERAEWIGHIYEIKYLREQVEHLVRTSPVSKDHEFELITQQLKQRAARDRQKAASKDELATIECPVCFNEFLLADLHVNLPCGHGFCKACIAKPCIPPGRAAPPGTECFCCRANVASVLHIEVG